MDQTILFVIIGSASLLGGLLVGKIVFARNTKKQVEEAEAKAATILKEAELRAETIKKEKQVEAKEHFVQLKSEYDRDLLERNKKMGEAENRIKQKEISINRKQVEFTKNIKAVGEHKVAIRLSTKLLPELTVKVVAINSNK